MTIMITLFKVLFSTIADQGNINDRFLVVMVTHVANV